MHLNQYINTPLLQIMSDRYNSIKNRFLASDQSNSNPQKPNLDPIELENQISSLIKKIDQAKDGDIIDLTCRLGKLLTLREQLNRD